MKKAFMATTAFMMVLASGLDRDADAERERGRS
jgi:hypothetical protein